MDDCAVRRLDGQKSDSVNRIGRVTRHRVVVRTPEAEPMALVIFRRVPKNRVVIGEGEDDTVACEAAYNAVL